MHCTAQLNRLMCLCPWFLLDFPSDHRLQQALPAATSVAVWQVTCSHAMQPDGCAVGHCGIVLKIALDQFKMYQALSAVSWVNLMASGQVFFNSAALLCWSLMACGSHRIWSYLRCLFPEIFLTIWHIFNQLAAFPCWVSNGTLIIPRRTLVPATWNSIWSPASKAVNVLPYCSICNPFSHSISQIWTNVMGSVTSQRPSRCTATSLLPGVTVKHVIKSTFLIPCNIM